MKIDRKAAHQTLFNMSRKFGSPYINPAWLAQFCDEYDRQAPSSELEEAVHNLSDVSIGVAVSFDRDEEAEAMRVAWSRVNAALEENQK